MIDVKQEKFDFLSPFNQLTTRPISNCEGKPNFCFFYDLVNIKCEFKRLEWV